MQASQETTLADALAAAMKQIDAACEDAAKRIGEQPDNPAVRRLDASKNAFVIQASEVFESKNWDVFRHDWLAQYRHIQQLLADHKFGALSELLQTGSWYHASHGRRFFAPEVIENVKRITGDLRSAVKNVDATQVAKVAAMDDVEIERAEPRQLMKKGQLRPR